MRAALISLRSKSSQWIVEAMKSYFDEVDDIDLKDIEVRTSTHGLILRYKGGKLPEYDCVYAKGSFRFPLLLKSIAEVLSPKCYMPLRPEAFTVGPDKWLTYLALQRNGIPMPATYLSPTLDIAKKILKEVTYPVIMKFPSGTQGKGVMYAGDYAAASSMLDALSALNQAVIIQEYIETDGTDMRIIVAGDEVAAAMRRIAVAEEKRANIHAGGKGVAFEPDEITKRIAIKTAHVVGADICAVDLLPSAKGPLVIEVNLSPGLQGITKATGINVADRLAKFLYKKAQEHLSKKSSSDSSSVFKEMGIDENGEKNATELITNLEFRGQRVLLPESVTKLAKLNDKDEYTVKLDGKALTIRMI
jgi:ribosomal protein S6--L-glutamate ligase